MEYKTSFLYEFTKIEGVSFILLFLTEIVNCNCDKVVCNKMGG